MSERRKIIKTLEIIELPEDESLPNLIKLLNSYVEKYPEKNLRAGISVTREEFDQYPEIDIYELRPETDEELKNRLDRQKQAKNRRIKEAQELLVSEGFDVTKKETQKEPSSQAFCDRCWCEPCHCE